MEFVKTEQEFFSIAGLENPLFLFDLQQTGMAVMKNAIRLMKRSVFSLILLAISGTAALLMTCKEGCKDEPDSQKKFLIPGEKVRDIEGNVYPTVIIGKQEWMTENLKTTSYNDGKPISYLGHDKKARKVFCWYNNDRENKNTYGALYSWYAVNTRKLAPKGWHVPDTAEWHAMLRYLGDSAINKLQDTNYWLSRNPNATNSTGFNALPSGLGRVVNLQTSTYNFTGKGQWGSWWSSKDPDNKSPYQHFAFYMAENSNSWQIYKQYEPEDYCMSVRCLKNTPPIVTTLPVTETSFSSVLANGRVITNGGSGILSRGFCWYEVQNPQTRLSKTFKTKGLGLFHIKIADLKPGTGYIIKAFAKNNLGTSYGEEISFVTKRHF
jgi:uncharacterized protein (TIGR02145 family)